MEKQEYRDYYVAQGNPLKRVSNFMTFAAAKAEADRLTATGTPATIGYQPGF